MEWSYSIAISVGIIVLVLAIQLGRINENLISIEKDLSTIAKYLSKEYRT